MALRERRMRVTGEDFRKSKENVLYRKIETTPQGASCFLTVASMLRFALAVRTFALTLWQACTCRPLAQGARGCGRYVCLVFLDFCEFVDFVCAAALSIHDDPSEQPLSALVP